MTNNGINHAPLYDLVIIGGGVNGAAIARDAAGRGFKTALFEAGDLACATSSASTKLIHGGLRYLEYGELRLVQKSLKEREILLRSAPHIIWPMRFILPIGPNTRPAWMVGLGLWLYDRLASRDILSASRKLALDEDDAGAPLLGQYRTGFSYADCWVDDARFVVLQAVDAARNSAAIFTRTPVRVVTAGDGGVWHIGTGAGAVRARMVINAGGTWVRRILDENDLSDSTTPDIRLVRGSHIVVPRIFDGDHAYLMQQPDKRIVFAIPYEKNFTLIGTTDADHGTDPDVVPVCTADEASYLCEAANRYFEKRIAISDIVSSYSGVRALYDSGNQNASAVTRDYTLYTQDVSGAPILSVFGGKITTAHVLALDVMETVEERLGAKAPAWTHRTQLPGGGMVDRDFGEFLADVAALFPWCPQPLLERLARAYGTDMGYILQGAKDVSELGRHFGSTLYAREVDYLYCNEWARTAEDILWRRSKLGLHIGADAARAIDDYLKKRF